MTRARLVRAAAVLSIPVAAVFVTLALDLLAWERSLEAQDLEFSALPAQSTFSPPASRLPGDLAERLLGGADDLAFRSALQRFARVRPRSAGAYSDLRRQLRTETQLQLSTLSLTDPDRGRRSRAANMIGVVALDPNEAPSDAAQLASLIAGAIGTFRNAVEIDPSNADAKHNLELALRIAGFANLPGSEPSGSPQGGELAGAGTPGSGY